MTKKPTTGLNHPYEEDENVEVDFNSRLGVPFPVGKSSI
jgi:hypothetical protein